VNFTAVKQLTDLFASSNLTSLTYGDSEFKLSLSADSAHTAAPVVRGVASVEPATPPATLISAVTVTSPVVGTVYRAREPGKAPLVSPGDAVMTGDTLCVIEAMKMFSEITAPCSGTVAEIVFTDGQLAEFGSTLIILEAAE
jgi:acetyl-CoA carboxylase biotin carboxyl carrier protein